MTFAKSTLSLLCPLLFSGGLSAAVLGEMTVRSVPGEPLDAILTIEDVDLSSTTSMVRVAPPGTYLREGVAWPEQVQDLKLKRDAAADNNVTVRVVGSETLGTESFPLLIELNVGGNVTVRQYVLHAENGRFAVTADLPRRTVTAPETPAVSSVTMAAASDPKEVKALKRRLAKKGRYAPSVVRDYVALNGFDSTQPFSVIEDMTIWSIAKLYWPVFEGCTMEQLVVGFEEKNPGAFLSDDPSKLVIGSRLTAPTRAEVLAIDPVAAFRRVHGNDTAIPMPTQNLIDAQAMSLETAEKTARAQTEARERGLVTAEVAAAGRAAIEADRAERTQARELMGDEHPGTAPAAQSAEPSATKTEAAEPVAESAAKSAEPTAETNGNAAEIAAPSETTSVDEASETEPEASEEAPASASEELPNPDDAADQSVTQDSLNRPADPAIAEAVSEQNAEVQAPAKEPAEEKPSEETALQNAATSAEPAFAAEPEKTAATEEKKDESSGISGGVIGVGVLILLFLWWLLRRKKSEGDDPEAKPEQTVTLAKDIPPSSPAQLKALERTVDEAVKNGTTAGAMGAGAAAFAEEKARGEETAPSDEAGKEASASGTPLEAEAKPAEPAAQPWLEPDDEMPPVDEEERSRTSDKAVSDVVGDLTLDLDDHEEKTPAPAPEAPELPPVAAEEPVSHLRSEREVAQTAAIDGKLKLAQAFVGLGALKEARELLAEVREKGTAQQREHAKFLEERIAGEKA